MKQLLKIASKTLLGLICFASSTLGSGVSSAGQDFSWADRYVGAGQYQIEGQNFQPCESIEVQFTDNPIMYSMRSICQGKVRRYWIDEDFQAHDGGLYFEGNKVGFYDSESIQFQVYVRSDDVYYKMSLKKQNGSFEFDDQYSLDGLVDGFRGNLNNKP